MKRLPHPAGRALQTQRKFVSLAWSRVTPHPLRYALRGNIYCQYCNTVRDYKSVRGRMAAWTLLVFTYFCTTSTIKSYEAGKVIFRSASSKTTNTNFSWLVYNVCFVCASHDVRHGKGDINNAPWTRPAAELRTLLDVPLTILIYFHDSLLGHGKNYLFWWRTDDLKKKFYACICAHENGQCERHESGSSKIPVFFYSLA